MARVSLSDNITDEMQKMIIEQMQPGDKVPPELDLAEQFGVGRSTIRESMKALVARGIVTRRNEGTFVADNVNEALIDPLDLMINMKIGKLQDLIELRELLELATIRIAAERATPELLEELEFINWKMQEPGASPPQRQALDIEFHNTIAKATGNNMLMELINALRQVIAKNLEHPEELEPIVQDSRASHMQLIDAIRSHDGEKAYKTLESYFEIFRK